MMAVIQIMVGGALGALARYGLLSILRIPSPWNLFAINCIGAGLAGGFMALLPLAGVLHWRLLISIGLLGSFTTFSSFILDMYVLFMQNQYFTALLYAFGSVSLGLLLFTAVNYIVNYFLHLF